MLFNEKDSSTIIGALTQGKQNRIQYAQDTAAYQRVYDTIKQSNDPTAVFNGMNLNTARDMSDAVKTSLEGIKKQVQEGTMTAEQGLVKINGLITDSAVKGTKLGSTFANIGKTLLNGLASAAISIAITALISLISDLADKLIMTRKEAEALSKQFEDTFATNAASQAKIVKELSEIEDEYKELSKGVSALGENLSLTDDEYERYKQLTEQIATGMPNLIQGYTDQGIAIINLKGNVESLTEAYRENQKVAAADLYNMTNDDGNIIKGVYKKANSDMASDFYEQNNGNKQVEVDIQEQLRVRQQLAKASFKEIQRLYEQGGYARKLLLDLINDTGLNIEDENDKNKVHEKLVEQATDLENTLKTNAKRVSEAGLTYAQAYTDFYDLSADKQKYITAVMNNLDHDFLLSEGLYDEDNMKKFVDEKLIPAFKGISDKDLAKLELGVNLSTQWNNDELTYEEYIKKIQELGELLETLFPGNKQIQESIKVLFDIPDIEELENKQDIFVNRIGEKRMVASRAAEKNQPTVLDTEREKLSAWGRKAGTDYTKFEKDIDNGILHRFGNVDMDKRAIIKWSDELKKTYQKELDSWEYNPEVGSIDTVWGGSDSFNWDDEEHEIAFTPIMQTDHGAVFLGKDEVMNYIDSVIAKAGEDGEITAEEIFAIDATETGHMYGEQFGKGLIAGVDDITGNKGIGARAAGDLMHFSGKFGAYALAKKADAQPTGSMAGMPSDVRQRLEKQYAGVADRWYDTLTLSQRKFVDNLSDEDLAEAVNFDSTEEFDEWLAKLMSDANENLNLEVKASDAVDSMADAKTAISSLSDLYEQTVSKSVSEGLANGFADPATINSIESAFSKFSQAAEEKGDTAGAAAINGALENFEKTLIEFPNDAQVAQDAIDSLITAYIDQTDIIKNLTEENAEWSEAELKAMGIENAHEVVQSRLSKQVKATSKAIATLARAFDDYNKALESGDESKRAAAMSDLVGATKDAIANRDEEGNIVSGAQNAFLDSVTEGWVQAHIDDVQKMADGDLEALDRVRLAAAKGAAMEVMVNVPTDVAEAQVGNIMDMVAQADAKNIEIGSYIDDAPFLESLANMMAASDETAEAVSAAFESMGYEVEWEPNKYEATVARAILETGGTGNTTADEAMKAGVARLETMKATMDVPSLKIKRTSSARGGTPANYRPTSNTNGGGGGGGGGDNGSTPSAKNWKTEEDNKQEDVISDDTKEEFDWIEVKIKNIEQEISNLNNQATDTFSTWGDRAKALNKELSKTTEEIKAQEAASRHYNDYANKVKINDGKLIKRSDYGYNEKELKSDKKNLNKALTNDWKNGNNDYVKKILEGKADEIDIEKIENEFTVHIIKRAVAAYNNNKDKKGMTKEKLAELVKNPIFKEGGKTRLDKYKLTKDMYTDNPKQYYYDKVLYKEATKLWKSGKYQKLVQQGKIGYKDIETINNKFLAEAIKEYKEWYDKSDEAKQKTKELQHQLKELNKQKFDNIKEEYTELVNLISKKVELIDAMISTIQEKGFVVDETYYRKQLEHEKSNLSYLQKEREKLYKQFTDNIANGTWAIGSTEYNSALEVIRGIDVEIQKSAENTAKWNNEIRQLQWDKFDHLWDRLSDINKEAEMFTSIFTLEKTMDESGNYTNNGWANMAMIGTEYDLAAEKMNDYRKKRQEFERTMDWNNEKDVEHWRNLADGEREATKELVNYSNTIKNQVQESINAHLNKLKELMDQYKSTLSAAKDLYSFQKNVENQTKQISNLRKQLIAYQSDDSEAGRKRRQELTNQLQSAEQQLQETEWDRYINQTSQVLDNLYNNYSKELNKVFDDIKKLVDNELGETNSHIDNIKTAFETAEQTYGIEPVTLKGYIDGNANAIVAALGKDGVLNTTLTAVGESISFIKEKVDEMYQKANEEANINLTNQALKDFEDDLGIVNGKTEAAQKKSIEKTYKKTTASRDEYEQQQQKAKEDKKENSLMKAMIKFANSLMTDSSATTKKKVTKAIKKKYATGTKKVLNDELAWTQDAGSELIYRTTDGAILTPLGAGDMVFTNEMSKRLWEIASGDLPSSVGTTKVPNISSNNQSTINLDNQISISLPNVKDYDSFKKELQNDSRFEKFIQEVTLGQAMGNNKLNKRKY